MDTVTEQQLKALRLSGFLHALREQQENPSYQELPFTERLKFLVEREWTARQNQKLERMHRDAQLKIASATVEAIDYSLPRALNRTQILELAQCSWIEQKQTLIITGPTGAGKTFLGCALADRALRRGLSVRYYRTSDLVQALLMARADGSLGKLSARLASYDLLVIDEWLRDALTETHAKPLFDLFDDRYKVAATMLISQLDRENWYQRIIEPTLAEGILDRIVHDELCIKISGDSVRKTLAHRRLATQSLL